MDYNYINWMTIWAQPGADGSISFVPRASNVRISYMGYDSRGNGTVSVDGNGESGVKIMDDLGRGLAWQLANADV